MQFKIEQIAITPRNPERAFDLLKKIGLLNWTKDTVVASGAVWGEEGANKANLAFNYEAFAGKEFEVLEYISGPNWMEHEHRVSHLGMHCTELELAGWKDFFAKEGIIVAQEVFTQSHTNEFLVNNGRKYHYCIFSTYDILGVDLKFIVRREKA